MNYFNITSTTLEEMAAYKNMTPEDLMQKSITEILQLNAGIKEEKAHNEALRNAADEEYIRLVKKVLHTICNAGKILQRRRYYHCLLQSPCYA